MRARRTARFGRKKKNQAFDVDITTLLDVLITLLFFLSKTFDASGITIDVADQVRLPDSETQSRTAPGVMVQVAEGMIWVDDKVVLDTKTSKGRIYDMNGHRIIPLFDELVAKKNTIEAIQKSSENAQKFTGIINLAIDKAINYDLVKKVMYTAAEAGFVKYKFVVLGEGGGM